MTDETTRPDDPGLVPPGTVVVGVDGSVASRAALRFAFEEAKLRRGALAVVMGDGGARDEITEGGDSATSASGMATPVAAVAEILGRPRRVSNDDRIKRIVSEEIGTSTDVPVEVEAWAGRPARIITDRSTSACMVVVGTHAHRDWRRLRLGSVTEEVVHGATCPVVVVRRSRRRQPGRPSGGGRVVLGLDVTGGMPSPDPDLIDFALGEARMRSGGLQVAAARGLTMADQYRTGRPMVPADDDLETAIAGLVGDTAAASGVEVNVRLRRGIVVDVLLRASKPAALPVVGSKYDPVVRLAPGSLQRQLVQRASCPVAIFNSPA